MIFLFSFFFCMIGVCDKRNLTNGSTNRTDDKGSGWFFDSNLANSYC